MKVGVLTTIDPALRYFHRRKPKKLNKTKKEEVKIYVYYSF